MGRAESHLLFYPTSYFSDPPVLLLPELAAGMGRQHVHAYNVKQTYTAIVEREEG